MFFQWPKCKDNFFEKNPDWSKQKFILTLEVHVSAGVHSQSFFFSVMLTPKIVYLLYILLD